MGVFCFCRESCGYTVCPEARHTTGGHAFTMRRRVVAKQGLRDDLERRLTWKPVPGTVSTRPVEVMVMQTMDITDAWADAWPSSAVHV